MWSLPTFGSSGSVASFFADGEVGFIQPSEGELLTCVGLLEDIAVASGLRVNFQKTHAHLISSSVDQGALVGQILGCEIKPFPCTYLGIPLGLRKPGVVQLLPLVEKLEKILQSWSTPLISPGGRLTLVGHTLSVMPIYAMMSLALPFKTIESIEKVCRGFLWKGRKDARGGHCLVSWQAVCSPQNLAGRLGIPNLRLLNIALQVRWGWLQKSDSERPWSEFNIQIPNLATEVCSAATVVVVRNGNRASFWRDRSLVRGGSPV